MRSPCEETKEADWLVPTRFKGYRFGEALKEKTSREADKVRKTWRPNHGMVDLAEDITEIIVHGENYSAILQ